MAAIFCFRVHGSEQCDHQGMRHASSVRLMWPRSTPPDNTETWQKSLRGLGIGRTAGSVGAGSQALCGWVSKLTISSQRQKTRPASSRYPQSPSFPFFSPRFRVTTPHGRPRGRRQVNVAGFSGELPFGVCACPPSIVVAPT